MISPEALEKARAIVSPWVNTFGITPDEESEIIQTIAAALQAERDAVAPKLPDDLAGLVKELRDAAHLNAGPLGPEARAEHRAAAALQSLVARNAELEADNKRLKVAVDDARRRNTNAEYMALAYRNMLGEAGLAVAKMWDDTRTKRVHFDWGPDADKMTGEERAQFILSLEKLPHEPWPDTDSDMPHLDAPDQTSLDRQP